MHAILDLETGWIEPPFAGRPFALLLVNALQGVPVPIQASTAKSIFAAGCRYAACAGIDCSAWHDAIDGASLPADEYSPLDQDFVLTSWHEDESPGDVVWYLLNCTDFAEHRFDRYLLLFTGKDPTVEQAFCDACLRDEEA